MHDSGHHDELIDNLEMELAEEFESSTQAIYVYMDDTHKLCNAKFASLLGYSSPQEWASVKGNFPSVFVAGESQEALIGAFQKSMENFEGSSINVVWKTKAGGNVKTKVILVPLVFEGHRVALHFVSK